MRIHESDFYSFGLGAFVAWLWTYLSLTHEKRLVKRIRSQVDHLRLYQDLEHRRYARTADMATDGEVLEAHGWAVKRKAMKFQVRQKFHPVALAAEVLICEKLLGLTEVHALRAILRTEDPTKLNAALRAIVVELNEDDRFPPCSADRIPEEPVEPEPRQPMVRR